jgi:hypothetical protein
VPDESPIAGRVREILDAAVTRLHAKVTATSHEGKCESCGQSFGLSEADARTLEILVRTDKLLREERLKDADAKKKAPNSTPIGRSKAKLVSELAEANTEA